MKKKLLLIFLCLGVFSSFASHITGGEMIYEYLGPGSTPNTKKYRITLRLFRDNDCTACAGMPADVYIGVFNNDNGSEYPTSSPFDVPIASETLVPVDPFPPCIVNPPDLSYDVGSYPFIVDLPDNTNGYTATYQTCCRVNPLENVYNFAGVGGTGVTYNCTIPGNFQLPVGVNSSPQFSMAVSLLCSGKPFTLDFSSTDSDGDSLVYSFAPAYNGGFAQDASNINPNPPPYGSVTYINGYAFVAPMGSSVTINSRTGIISGIAPTPGKYVVCVMVKEYRNGVYFASSRKDFIENVGSCDFAGAQLNPKPASCDGFTVTFANDNTSSLNHTFYWVFDTLRSVTDTSTLENPTWTYADTGTFVYKLVVNRGQPCSDSAYQTIKVYPGVFGFTYTSSCTNKPVQFTDQTHSPYWVPNLWSWNFGDPTTAADTSHLQNPQWTYTQPGTYNAYLTVATTKGCQETIGPIQVNVDDKPALTTIPKLDTLICNIDFLVLNAQSPQPGSYFWTPNYNINNQNLQSPTVSPQVDTTYHVHFLGANGCENTDSVRVHVVTHVTLAPLRDTTICQGDAITLTPVSNALHYFWSPSTYLNDPTAQNPIAIPLANIQYHLVATIGLCDASTDEKIKVVPYPLANAGLDSTICIGTSAQLHASGGSIYLWSPVFFLSNPHIADPIATPDRTIQYIVTVSDTLGCPKPVNDTVIVHVDNVIAIAIPADTSVVIGQPLQLLATGGVFYLWTPATGLNSNTIPNPIAYVTSDMIYYVKVSSAAGCFDTASVHVHFYNVEPDLFVPNAFSPNGDGLNDVFRPVAIGMKKLNYFMVYNRWGQLVFSTTELNKGWDGSFKGKPQDAAGYVWMVQGVTYTGKLITKKGTMVLVR
jgi:gliding motility-associated-like protein